MLHWMKLLRDTSSGSRFLGAGMFRKETKAMLSYEEIISNEYQRKSPNVAQIRSEGCRVVKNKLPMQIRRELMKAVKDGSLGRLKKDGLKPEIFYHPAHVNSAREKHANEALYKIELIKNAFA